MVMSYVNTGSYDLLRAFKISLVYTVLFVYMIRSNCVCRSSSKYFSNIYSVRKTTVDSIMEE